MANGNGNKSDTVSQSEINGILWKACDTFRGAVDRQLMLGEISKVMGKELIDSDEPVADDDFD